MATLTIAQYMEKTGIKSRQVVRYALKKGKQLPGVLEITPTPRLTILLVSDQWLKEIDNNQNRFKEHK